MEFAILTTKEFYGVDVGSGTDYKKILYTESTPATGSITTDVHGMTELLQIIIKISLIAGRKGHLRLSILSRFLAVICVRNMQSIEFTVNLDKNTVKGGNKVPNI